MKLVCVGGPLNDEEVEVPVNRVHLHAEWRLPYRISPLPTAAFRAENDAPSIPDYTVEVYVMEVIGKRWYLVYGKTYGQTV